MKNRIKTAVILAAFCGALALVFPQNRQTAQTKQSIETAGQKFKSITVLNDMPADQMGKIMNMMSASLGVNCAFCHTSDDGDYEKEGVENKDMARRMLKMTFELNKNYFGSRPEINCNSCHQGRTRPQSLLSPIPTLQEPRPVQPEKKPTVDEILAKYEAVLGGKANLAKVTSREIKAQRLEPDGKTFEAEEVLQKGVKMSVTTVYPSKQYGDYTVREVFDGSTAAKFGNDGKIELKADETEQIKREAQLFANADLKAVYERIEFRSVDKIDGREVYVLNASTAENFRERLYFDLQTGLLVRRIASTPTVLGLFQLQVDYTEHKDFGGVKLPTVIKFAVPHIRWTRKVLDVKNNVTIDDTKFVK